MLTNEERIRLQISCKDCQTKFLIFENFFNDTHVDCKCPKCGLLIYTGHI